VAQNPVHQKGYRNFGQMQWLDIRSKSWILDIATFRRQNLIISCQLLMAHCGWASFGTWDSKPEKNRNLAFVWQEETHLPVVGNFGCITRDHFQQCI
jgi:hypothetical protein